MTAAGLLESGHVPGSAFRLAPHSSAVMRHGRQDINIACCAHTPKAPLAEHSGPSVRVAHAHVDRLADALLRGAAR